MFDDATLNALIALAYRIGRLDERGDSVELPDTTLGALIARARNTHQSREITTAEQSLAPWHAAIEDAIRRLGPFPPPPAQELSLNDVIEFDTRQAARGDTYFWRITQHTIAPDWHGPYTHKAAAHAAALEILLRYAARGASRSPENNQH